MPDHLHFVAGPGASGTSVWELLRRLHGASTHALWKTGWTGKVWQPKGFDVQVTGWEALEEIAAYMHLNPVRAGLVQEAEEWPWSGCLDPWDDLPNY